MQGLQYLPKIYVLGCTNSGKSSFINALLFKSNKYKDASKNHYREKYNVLTEAALPGTTLDLVTVEQFKIGYRVIDTPGIPNLNQVSSHIKDYEDLMTVLPSKVLNSFSISVKQGYSVWLGALCRIDVLSGSDKYFTFFMP
jgi:30S ribosome assembly GTPase